MGGSLAPRAGSRFSRPAPRCCAVSGAAGPMREGGSPVGSGGVPALCSARRAMAPLSHRVGSRRTAGADAALPAGSRRRRGRDPAAGWGCGAAAGAGWGETHSRCPHSFPLDAPLSQTRSCPRCCSPPFLIAAPLGPHPCPPSLPLSVPPAAPPSLLPSIAPRRGSRVLWGAVGGTCGAQTTNGSPLRGPGHLSAPSAPAPAVLESNGSPTPPPPSALRDGEVVQVPVALPPPGDASTLTSSPEGLGFPGPGSSGAGSSPPIPGSALPTSKSQ